MDFKRITILAGIDAKCEYLVHYRTVVVSHLTITVHLQRYSQRYLGHQEDSCVLLVDDWRTGNANIGRDIIFADCRANISIADAIAEKPRFALTLRQSGRVSAWCARVGAAFVRRGNL